MAEIHSESEENSIVPSDVREPPLEAEVRNSVNMKCVLVSDSETRSNKRCSSENIAPSPKSPRTDFPSPETEERTEAEAQELESENTDTQTCPPSPPDRRKSWRRATITRRSLPALPNPYQVLCRSICTSLSQTERLEKLMEASMKMTLDRTMSSLQTAPHSSIESFQSKVDQMHKEWTCLAKTIRSESQSDATAASPADSSVKEDEEKIKKAIHRLKIEKESWEALLTKHRDEAEKLERKIQKGQERGITLDSASLAQHSSQNEVIMTKPDYKLVLSRQLPRLRTMTVIMDSQCKMVKTLLSIRDQSQLVVKETSGLLAAESGLLELSSDLVKNLITQPLASAVQ
ncbi:unnamed protein product [Knipowitschia caucasica]|uniref:Uncharacterized protein n=1 Tax=Knipowitschia caucasica TaxID=637954 RepID=A0AAV2KE30_KNICA